MTRSVNWGSATFAVVVGAVCCGGVDVTSRPTAGDGEGAPSESPSVAVAQIDRDVPEGSEALTFPPSLDGRRDREGLPKQYQRASDQTLQLVYPSSDDDAFTIHGKTLRFQFNKPMRGAGAGTAAGTNLLVERVDPKPGAGPVTGLATWDDDRSLVFEATRFFNPTTQYRVKLVGIASAGGEAFSDRAWTFKSTVGGMVAGKTVGHRIVPGVPRVVALDAASDGEVAPSPHLSVLYDQPIHVDLARTLITVEDDDGTVIPVSFRPGFRPTWGGVRVDPRLVVVVSPKRPLPRGTDLRLVARDVRQGKIEVAMKVADPLTLTGATCGWWLRDDAICELVGDRLRTNQKSVHLRFSNRIGTPPKTLRHAVRVRPAVRNLAIAAEGWDEGRLILHGDFRPSVRYRITASGLRDRFGQRLAQPVKLELEMDPLGASVSMSEGLVFLDEATTKSFRLHSRNVEEAELLLWRVDESDRQAFAAALDQARGSELSATAPDEQLNIAIKSKRDELIETRVDLRAALAGGGSWLASLRPKRFAFGASPVKHPKGTPAARPPVALLKGGNANSLAVHAHRVGAATLVQVARLDSGLPVAGATAVLDGTPATTDAQGVALVFGGGDLLAVDDKANGTKLLLPLDQGATESASLFPELARGEAGGAGARSFVISDRGIYRPGATLHLKGAVFGQNGAKLTPMANEGVTLAVLGPNGDRVCALERNTSDLGSVAADCALPADAKLGLHRIELIKGEAVIGREIVRVADFEPPRFKVDVDASSEGGDLRASVAAKYLFGSPMGGAYAKWSLKREAASLPSGPLGDAGLAFASGRSWMDEDRPEKWSRTGEGALDALGKLAIVQALDLSGTIGPQRFAIEADVTDASYRHVAGRQAIVVHPAERYAGVKGPQGWVNVGAEVPVELGVADREGKPVVGAAVTARLERVSWRYVERLGPGGSVHTEWRRSEREVARCSVKSAAKPSTCQLRVPRWGDYRLVASVDGRDGGAQWFWAWSSDRVPRKDASPSRGSTVQVMADKAKYDAGDTAKLLVRSPYPAATLVTTVEMGGLLTHQSQRIDGPVGVVKVPIEAAHAPHLHATMTLLPIGAEGRDKVSHRVGAIRLPVASKGTGLTVTVASDRAQYQPRARATLSIQVTDGGKPEPHAEVALAVVDEGVLRLTNFHASDPARALRPPMALAFTSFDSRRGLGRLFEQSHVAGDGGGASEGSMPHTRRRFVETALWSPTLRTDAQGRAEVAFELPDNLTEFRMMAVAFDREGKGGRDEASFLVKKEVMIDAIVPRFAHVGDDVEFAAMVHNGGEARFDGLVTIDGQEHPVSVPAGGRQRVSLRRHMEASTERSVMVGVTDGSGALRDQMLRTLKVTQPGMSVNPTLASAFRGSKDIDLTIPASVLIDEEAELVIKMGEHLWPELGERLEYLLRYPHGCVEQTTSSTMPLIVAREILPRIGFDKHGDAFFTKRIAAGIKRLSTMRTRSGGLAYWPGDSEPSIFGTAYAIRAVLGAERAGVPIPAGMKAGMMRFLEDKLLAASTHVELRAVIAESLARREEGLPPGIADALWDRKGDMTPFARASLALALSRDDDQADRVTELIDGLGELFEGDGDFKETPGLMPRYYGSVQRTEAQIARAFSSAGGTHTALPPLVRKLAQNPGGYTTQSTAFALLALADHLRDTPTDGAEVQALLDGQAVPIHRQLASGAREIRIPLRKLAGTRHKLRLRADGDRAVGFTVSARYRVPLEAQGSDAEARATSELAAASGEKGPDIYRLMTTAEGDPIDPTKIAAGDMVRIALLVRFPRSGDYRHAYLALTDHLPAGLAPVDTDLATVASDPGVGAQHPFADPLRYSRHQLSHLEMHDDKVQVYLDEVRGHEVAISYLARATTPGQFAQPPAVAELMYEPNSTSYTEQSQVRIQ
jgi:alpha-2-macroglobulin